VRLLRLLRLLRPLLPLLLAAPLLVSCTSSDGPARPAGFRPPPASSFRAGDCAAIADDLVALGRATYDLRGVASPDQTARDTLLGAQDRVAAIAETADPSVKPALDRVVLTSGLVRIQADTRMLKPEVLDDLRAAYEAAVAACTDGATATPSP
jgi:hypothetical protein